MCSRNNTSIPFKLSSSFLYASAGVLADLLAGVDAGVYPAPPGFWRPARRQALRCRAWSPQGASGRPRRRFFACVVPKEVAPRRRRPRLSSVNSRFFFCGDATLATPGDRPGRELSPYTWRVAWTKCRRGLVVEAAAKTRIALNLNPALLCAGN